MNAVTQTEARAINTAAAIPLEAADPTKNLILVPLSRLVSRPTGRNVRKTPRMSIPELAASIQRVGLLQNLIVIAAADGEHYEVVAGDRRLAALKLLAKKHRISKEWEVPCLLVADGTARTASLTENVQREAMHPADQFEAFAALVAEGRSIEDIAADFSVTPLVVQRRLKLANVSPRLLADYRAEAVSLDQLMALAITDDHAAQEAAFYDAPTWQRGPHNLRDRLTEREIDAYRHPLVRFVGLDGYEQEGGGIRRDLFAEGDKGVYLTDAALLERLAQDKLAGIAAKVQAEGWAWVDAGHDPCRSASLPACAKGTPQSEQARRAAHRSCKPSCTNWPRRWMPRWTTRTRKGRCLAGRRRTPGRAVAGAGRWLAGLCGQREGRSRCHCHHRPRRAGRDSSRAAARSGGKALRTLERLRQGFGSEGEAANEDAGEDDEQPRPPPCLTDWRSG